LNLLKTAVAVNSICNLSLRLCYARGVIFPTSAHTSLPSWENDFIRPRHRVCNLHLRDDPASTNQIENRIRRSLRGSTVVRTATRKYLSGATAFSQCWRGGRTKGRKGESRMESERYTFLHLSVTKVLCNMHRAGQTRKNFLRLHLRNTQCTSILLTCTKFPAYECNRW